MQRLMRKYRTYILVFILLFIGLPMLFFGIPEFMNSQTDPKGEIIGQVGDEILYESAFRQNLDFAAKRYGGDTAPMPYPELYTLGHADKVMEEMVDSALININEQKRDFSISDDAASEMMKSWNEFQDKDGNFDQAAFEAWRDKQNDRGMNWNALYKELQTSLERQVYMNLALVAAYRVPKEELENELSKRFEKIRIRYTKVAPPVYLSDADIQAYYDSHLNRYQAVEQRVAQFIAVQIATARPTKADEVFKALAAGDDFASVADTFSDQQVKNGGDLGWQAPLEDEEPYRQKMFDLAVGEVSELVNAPQGYFIFKVDEERTNSETGKREVKARQIFLLNPSMSEDERVAQTAKMSEIVAEANTNGIDAASAKFQLPVQVTGSFDTNSVEIENIPRTDAKEFRDMMLSKKVDEPYFTINGRENNYCAKLTEVAPGPIKPLEEVREQVIQDAKRDKNLDEEFRKRTQAYAYKIGREIKSLDDIKSVYPDIEMEIKESTPFGSQDNLFEQGLQLIADELFKEFYGKEPGYVIGPIKNFVSEYFFVELLERIPPTEEDKAKLEEDRKTTLDALLTQNTASYLKDYRLNLRESMLPNYSPDINQARVQEILGITEDTEEAGTASPEGASTTPATPTSTDTLTIDPTTTTPTSLTIPTPASAPTDAPATAAPATITIPTPEPAPAESAPTAETTPAPADAEAPAGN